MKNRRERERERNIPYTRADPYTYQIQKILMAAFITPSPWNPFLRGLWGIFVFLLSSWAVCVYRENGLTEICSSSFFFSLLLNIGFSVLFWLSLRMHEVREWFSFLFIFFSPWKKKRKKSRFFETCFDAFFEEVVWTW